MKSSMARRVPMGFSILAVAFCLMMTIPSVVEAAPDTVEIFDSDLFITQMDVFADSAMAFVSASDGSSIGGLTTADVTDETFGDMILVSLYDDGTGPGDVPDDGTYTGNFTIVYDDGVSGQYTDDLLDIIDLADGGTASVVVDIDMMMDGGTAMVWGDFSAPAVNITSPQETVDLEYTLTANVTDPNLDMNRIWYNVNGGQNQDMAWLGGDDFEGVIDTSALIDGPHAIRVIAYDIANNVNNTQIVVIDVHHPAPDISIILTVDPQEPKDGERVTFEVIIDNSGDADAEDVNVTLYLNGEEAVQQTTTIASSDTETVELHWTAAEGSYDVEVEVTQGLNRLASSTLPQPLEVGAADGNLLADPLVFWGIMILLTVGLIGGTIAGAYYGKELQKGSKKTKAPAEEVPVVPLSEDDPCGEIKRKWKAIVAEHERMMEEVESSRQRAESLRGKADEEWSEVDRVREEAQESNEAVMKAEMQVENVKQEMAGYFANNLLVDGISVGEHKPGLDNHMAYFRGVVTVYFRSSAYEEILNRFVDEYKHVYDELQEGFDEAEKVLRKTQADAAVENEKVAQAEVKARKVENLARQAEQEHEMLMQEAENMSEEAEAFRQKWRMCNLKRLDEVAEEAESAAEQASEAERGAQDASGIEEYENCKKQTEDAQSKGDKAKEEGETIKERLKKEDMDEDLEEYDDRMGRARSGIGSALESILGVGMLYYPDPERLGQPCKGEETQVLSEYTMQYQLLDPTREISMPEFYTVQAGGEAGEALAEHLAMIANICERTRDTIEDAPEGKLIGIPLDYWPTIMDAGMGALKRAEEKDDGLGFIKMQGMAIPTIQVTVTCREMMVCKDGTWQKTVEKSSVKAMVPGQINYHGEDTIQYNEAVEWIQGRLEKLMDQQKKFIETPCG